MPEVDVYTGLSPGAQFWFQAKRVREDGTPTQTEIGPSINFFIKQLKLQKLTVLDDSKKRFLVLSAGYRYLPVPGRPSQSRILLMATPNLSIKGGVLVSDRNRLEINFINGNAYWRYRNRLTLKKTIAVHSYRPSPYASSELYYNSKFGKWSATAVKAGCILPLGNRIILDPYYEHANATGVTPNQQTNAFGIAFSSSLRRFNQ